jgi:hypothetical protein
MQICSRPTRIRLQWGARTARLLVLGSLVAAAFGWSKSASADTMVIKRPGYHPRYGFEAEPHLLLGVIDPPGPANGNGIGFGFRGTIPLLNNGFIPTINNSVGIGFGIDFVHYGYGTDRCVAFNATGHCARYDGETNINDVWFPVVMQWNFFLSRNWSVFGEPGLALRYESNDGPNRGLKVEPFQLYVGGRYHFSDNVTLTIRLGYPTFSVGVSFLL